MPGLDQAAAWVLANSTAKVVITCYWQIGTDAPMGYAFDQIIQSLHNEFPTKQIGIGEFWHWGQGISQRW